MDTDVSTFWGTVQYWCFKVKHYRKSKKGVLELVRIRDVLIKDSRKNNLLAPVGTLNKRLRDDFASEYSISVIEADEHQAKLFLSTKRGVEEVEISD